MPFPKEECIECKDMPEGTVANGHDHSPDLKPETAFDPVFKKFTEAKTALDAEIEKEENEGAKRELYLVSLKLEEAVLWLQQANFILSVHQQINQELDGNE